MAASLDTATAAAQAVIAATKMATAAAADAKQQQQSHPPAVDYAAMFNPKRVSATTTADLFSFAGDPPSSTSSSAMTSGYGRGGGGGSGFKKRSRDIHPRDRVSIPPIKHQVLTPSAAGGAVPYQSVARDDLEILSSARSGIFDSIKASASYGPPILVDIDALFKLNDDQTAKVEFRNRRTGKESNIETMFLIGALVPTCYHGSYGDFKIKEKETAAAGGGGGADDGLDDIDDGKEKKGEKYMSEKLVNAKYMTRLGRVSNAMCEYLHIDPFSDDYLIWTRELKRISLQVADILMNNKQYFSKGNLQNIKTLWSTSLPDDEKLALNIRTKVMFPTKADDKKYRDMKTPLTPDQLGYDPLKLTAKLYQSRRYKRNIVRWTDADWNEIPADKLTKFGPKELMSCGDVVAIACHLDVNVGSSCGLAVRFDEGMMIRPTPLEIRQPRAKKMIPRPPLSQRWVFAQLQPASSSSSSSSSFASMSPAEISTTSAALLLPTSTTTSATTVTTITTKSEPTTNTE